MTSVEEGDIPHLVCASVLSYLLNLELSRPVVKPGMASVRSWLTELGLDSYWGLLEGCGYGTVDDLR